jgi:hypothetical protein
MDAEMLASICAAGAGSTSLLLALLFALYGGVFVALSVLAIPIFAGGVALALVSLIENQRSASTALVVVNGVGVFLACMLVAGVIR